MQSNYTIMNTYVPLISIAKRNGLVTPKVILMQVLGLIINNLLQNRKMPDLNVIPMHCKLVCVILVI